MLPTNTFQNDAPLTKRYPISTHTFSIPPLTISLRSIPIGRTPVSVRLYIKTQQLRRYRRVHDKHSRRERRRIGSDRPAFGKQFGREYVSIKHIFEFGRCVSLHIISVQFSLQSQSLRVV